MALKLHLHTKLRSELETASHASEVQLTGKDATCNTKHPIETFNRLSKHGIRVMYPCTEDSQWPKIDLSLRKS